MTLQMFLDKDTKMFTVEKCLARDWTEMWMQKIDFQLRNWQKICEYHYNLYDKFWRKLHAISRNNGI